MDNTFTPNASRATDKAGIPRFDTDRCEMHLTEPYRGGRGEGFKGIVTDKPTGTTWKVYGAPCGAGCYCAARVVQVKAR